MTMKALRTIFVCILIVALLCAGLFVAHQYTGAFGFLDGLFGKGLQLEKTANVVTQIRNISEFTTACYYEDLVIQEVKDSENTINKVSSWFGAESLSKDELCLIAQGKVRAGFNLSNLSEDAISISGDTLRLALPKPEIFDVIVNPSNYEVFVEEGDWSHEQVAAIQAKIRTQIEQDALNYGILEQADKIGRERLTELFKVFGYNSVIMK